MKLDNLFKIFKSKEKEKQTEYHARVEQQREAQARQQKKEQEIYTLLTQLSAKYPYRDKDNFVPAYDYDWDHEGKHLTVSELQSKYAGLTCTATRPDTKEIVHLKLTRIDDYRCIFEDQEKNSWIIMRLRKHTIGFPLVHNDAHNKEIHNEVKDFFKLVFKERNSKNEMVERWYYVHKKAHENISLIIRKNFDQHFWNTCSYNGLSGDLGKIPLLIKFQDYYHDKEDLVRGFPVKR